MCREQSTDSKAPARSNATERRSEAVEPMLSRGDLPTLRGSSAKAPDLLGSKPASSSTGQKSKPVDIFRQTQSGRILKKTVFADSVAQLVVALHAVYIKGKSSSIKVLAAPFEVISFKEAMQKDTPNWKTAMLQELRLLKESNAFLIVPIPSNRKVIHNR